MPIIHQKFIPMLLPTMNNAEITAQIFKEYDKLWDTTALRLTHEYIKERKKLKIDKERLYVKDYHVKTAGKNNWIIFIGKAPIRDKCISGADCTLSLLTYYYTGKGIRVLHVPAKKAVIAFNGHFFQRFNERLQLHYSRTLDIIVHFFKHNRDYHLTPYIDGGKARITGVCKDGILLGEFFPDEMWLIWKTFVSREFLSRHNQTKEHEVLNLLLEKTAHTDYTETQWLNVMSQAKSIIGDVKP